MNTNVLAGLQCPECKSDGPYQMTMKCFAEVADDGIDQTWEHEWGPTDFCRCIHCNFTGKVRNFEIKRKQGAGNKKGGKPRS